MGVIYCIKNLQNNKEYIGSAVNFVRRKRMHISQLNRNKHHSIVLQRAWTRYGEENFSFEILEEVENNELLNTEQVYLDNRRPSYNICKVAGSQLGLKRKRKNINALNALNSKKVIQYDRFGKKLKTWKSIMAVSKGLHLNYSSVWRCCNGVQKSAGGFIFKFKDNPVPFIGKASTARLSKEERRKKLIELRSKRYEVVCPDESILVVVNLKEFSESRGLTFRRMYAVASGKEKSHKGYKVRVAS